MTRLAELNSWSGALRLTACAVLAVSSLQAHAALFSDDEARRAILDLRAKVDANRQASDAAGQELKSQVDDSLGQTRRSMLDLVNQMESLRGEMAQLRGQNEQLLRDVAELQRRQKDGQGALDERLRVLEPLRVTVDGQEFTVQPDEKAAFDAAMDTLRTSDFNRAAQQYSQFLERYPNSGYAPITLYWLGNAQYALRNYKNAIDSYRKLLGLAPQHLRVPEAKLAIANCQLELKDAKAAKTTLQELAKAHPQTEAGATARDRLARMK
ncbi:MAG TPA: tol-pal system protein YbgF [Macromonas sp.]|nr:tol-pal system protein YbgF [Macromonas sp.]